MHKIEIAPLAKQRVLDWCGREHIFADIDPTKTAHIIVDLQNGFMAPGAAGEIPVAREIVPNVNRISAAVRATGGINVFIRYLLDPPTLVAWSHWFNKFMTPERLKLMEKTFAKGCEGFELWPALEVKDGDLIVDIERLGVLGDETPETVEHAKESREDVVQRHVVISRNNNFRERDRIQKFARFQELCRARPLGQVARDSDQIRFSNADEVEQSGNDGWIDVPKMQIGKMD